MHHAAPSQPAAKPSATPARSGSTPGGATAKPAAAGLKDKVKGLNYADGAAAVKPAAAAVGAATKPDAAAKPHYGPGKPDKAPPAKGFPEGPGTPPEAKKYTTPQHLADPALAKDDKTHQRETHEYKRMEGQLFVGGVQAQDIAQGWLSDCYLAAALSAVAQRYPNMIKEGMKDMGGDVYKVRFFKKSWDGKVTEKWVEVDADFPWYQDKNTWAYLQSMQKGELWPSLMEKAYAVFKSSGAGDYEKVGQGGWEGDVMEAITGKSASSDTIADLKDDPLWDKLMKASKGKKAMTAGTFSEKGENDPRYAPEVGIHGDHAYTVLGVKEKGRGKDKQRIVILRNPWGEGEPTGNGANDGVFEIPLALFREKYEALTILDE